MANFKQELINKLRSYNLTLKDIKWVGHIEIKYDKNNEVYINKYVKYNLNKFLNNINFKDYSNCEIRPDLIIVGEDWWLERLNYECWKFKQYPKEPKEVIDNFNLVKENKECIVNTKNLPSLNPPKKPTKKIKAILN